MKNPQIRRRPCWDARQTSGWVAIVSELDKQESRALSGIPGLSEVPGLNDITDKNVQRNGPRC
jgi:hypothetical protein